MSRKNLFAILLLTFILIGLALTFAILTQFVDSLSHKGMLAGLSLALVAMWSGYIAWFTSTTQAQETHRIVVDIQRRLDELGGSTAQRPGACEVLKRGGIRESHPGELRQVLFWERLKKSVPDLSFMDEIDRDGLRNRIDSLIKLSTPYELSYNSFRMGIAYESAKAQ